MNYAYNPNGSLTNATNDAFARATYHKHSCLPVNITGSGASVSLWYDSLGRRAAKTGVVNVSYRRGLHDGTLALSEKIGDVEKIYIEMPSGHRVSRAYKLFHRHSLDHLGSIRLRIDAMDCVSVMYSAFGESIIKGNDTRPEAAIRHTFTGYEIDEETNLMNAWRRMYSPTLARFVMVDPSLEFQSPYLYCYGDPFNHTDETGEISSAVISGIIAALTLIVSIVITVASYGAAAPLVAEGDTAALATVPVAVDDIALGIDDATPAAYEGLGLEERAMQESYDAANKFRNVTKMPTTKLGYATYSGIMGAGGTLVSNVAATITKATNGEHASAWQVVKAMLIEPIIAGVAGFAGGAIVGTGVLAFKGPVNVIAAYAADAALTSATTILLGDAMERKKIDGAELGLQIGIAVGEALLMSSVFTAVHPTARARPRIRIWLDKTLPQSKNPETLWSAISTYEYKYKEFAGEGSTVIGRNAYHHTKMGLQHIRMQFVMRRQQTVLQPQETFESLRRRYY